MFKKLIKADNEFLSEIKKAFKNFAQTSTGYREFFHYFILKRSDESLEFFLYDDEECFYYRLLATITPNGIIFTSAGDFTNDNDEFASDPELVINEIIGWTECILYSECEYLQPYLAALFEEFDSLEEEGYSAFSYNEDNIFFGLSTP